MMAEMQWNSDEQTRDAASSHPVFTERPLPATQYRGHPTDPLTWNDRVVQPATWGNRFLVCSPEEIIRQFRDRRWTQGCALVVSWGGMGRTSKRIYQDRRPEWIATIEQSLEKCANSILESTSIATSWEILTGGPNGQLNWTAVMSSKTLHSLCRSLGFERNPPVAIDGEPVVSG
jgi:hypothetical protein